MSAATQSDFDIPGYALADLTRAARDPSQLGFPPMLPVELALKIDTPANICACYGIDREQFATMVRHPLFIKAYADAVESLKKEGASFKMKARLQAEDHLATTYQMIKDKNTSDAVRADLIRSTVRWAGLEPKNSDGAGAGGVQFSINIDLS